MNPYKDVLITGVLITVIRCNCKCDVKLVTFKLKLRYVRY